MSVHVQLQVGAEAYAIPVEHVLEVSTIGHVRPVPGSRPELLGVCNLHGQILPVVDLASLLQVPAQAPPGCLLVAETAGHLAGLAIGGVSGIGELGDLTGAASSDLLAGTTVAQGALVGVLDLPRVFAELEQAPP